MAIKICILSSVHIALDNRVFYREACSLQRAGYDVTLIAVHDREEIKDADDVFSGLGREKSRADMLKMAEELIRTRSGDFDPTEFRNHYAEALRDLVKQKVESGGAVPVEDDSAPGAKVIDFMEALKRSLKGEESGTVKNAKKANKQPPAAKKTTRATSRKTTAKQKTRSKTTGRKKAS